ncbi:MAG TPA: BON domain-containing protein [Burkholderiales bacterium]|nr:BON domain-containing protein [Burkholderiales bacterium]
MNTDRTTLGITVCALTLVVTACNKPALQSEAANSMTTAQAEQATRSNMPATDPWKEKVAAALNGEPGLAAVSVDVNAADGTVILNGSTNNQENKTKASQIALNVPGVQSVQNNLIVKDVT